MIGIIATDYFKYAIIIIISSLIIIWIVRKIMK